MSQRAVAKVLAQSDPPPAPPQCLHAAAPTLATLSRSTGGGGRGEGEWVGSCRAQNRHKNRWDLWGVPCVMDGYGWARCAPVGESHLSLLLYKVLNRPWSPWTKSRLTGGGGGMKVITYAKKAPARLYIREIEQGIP